MRKSVIKVTLFSYTVNVATSHLQFLTCEPLTNLLNVREDYNVIPSRNPMNTLIMRRL